MIKLFTHTDLDGVGCAILGKLAFGENIDIEYCNYDSINNRIIKFLEESFDQEYMCYITDISVSEEVAQMIDKNSDNFYLLDHHVTASGLNVYDWCLVKIIDEFTRLKVSGTELFYEFLTKTNRLKRSSELDRFVRLVTDYDTWRWATLEESGRICKQVNDLLYIYGREKFINWCIKEIDDCLFPYLGDFDKKVLEIRQNEIDDYINSKDKDLMIKEVCGYKCGIIFAERFFSELGNKICERHSEIDFVAMIDMSGSISYRAVKDNIDLGKDIASLFGGGGHAKAAGSQITSDVVLKTLENIFAGNIKNI